MVSKEVDLKKQYISKLHSALAESLGKMDMMTNRIKRIKKNWNQLYKKIEPVWPEGIDTWMPDLEDIKQCMFMTELPNECEKYEAEWMTHKQRVQFELNEAEMEEMKRKSNKRVKKTNINVSAVPDPSVRKKTKPLPVFSTAKKRKFGSSKGSSSSLLKSYFTGKRSTITPTSRQNLVGDGRSVKALTGGSGSEYRRGSGEDRSGSIADGSDVGERSVFGERNDVGEGSGVGGGIDANGGGDGSGDGSGGDIDRNGGGDGSSGGGHGSIDDSFNSSGGGRGAGHEATQTIVVISEETAIEKAHNSGDGQDLNGGHISSGGPEIVVIDSPTSEPGFSGIPKSNSISDSVSGSNLGSDFSVLTNSSTESINSLVKITGNKRSRNSLLISEPRIIKSSKGKQKKVVQKIPQNLTLNFNPLTLLLMQKLLSSGNLDFNSFMNQQNKNDENDN